MRCLLALLLASSWVASPWAASASAQPATGDRAAPLYIGSDRPLMRLSMSGLVQRVTDGDLEVEQVTAPVSVFVPLGRTLGVSANVAYMQAESDSLAFVQGVTDAQLAASLRIPVGAARVVASVGVNLPADAVSEEVPRVGGRLSETEAQTAFLLGQGFYGFRTPSLGQGFNVAPGLTVALPLGDGLAVGVGAAYQMRGAFEPLTDTDDVYAPGAETLVTAGVDARLGAGSSAGLDVSYLRYAPDAWAGASYQTGDAVAATARVGATVGLQEMRLFGRVQLKADSEVPADTTTALGLDASVPLQARARASVRLRAGRWARLGLMAQARTYAESDVFASKTLIDVAATPELRLGSRLGLFARLGATTGSHRSVEVGGGLALNL